jgi:hypothetical protein
MPWALYHVRRLFLLSEDGRRRPVKRSTERVDLGRPHQLARRLISISERHGVDVEHDPVYGRARAWVRPRAKGWPIIGRGRYPGVGSRAGTGPREAVGTRPHGRRIMSHLGILAVLADQRSSLAFRRSDALMSVSPVWCLSMCSSPCGSSMAPDAP